MGKVRGTLLLDTCIRAHYPAAAASTDAAIPRCAHQSMYTASRIRDLDGMACDAISRQICAWYNTHVLYSLTVDIQRRSATPIPLDDHSSRGCANVLTWCHCVSLVSTYGVALGIDIAYYLCAFAFTLMHAGWWFKSTPVPLTDSSPRSFAVQPSPPFHRLTCHRVPLLCNPPSNRSPHDPAVTLLSAIFV